MKFDIQEMIIGVPILMLRLIDKRAVAAGGAVAFSGMPRPYLAAAAAGGVFYMMDDTTNYYTPNKRKLGLYATKAGSVALGALAARHMI